MAEFKEVMRQWRRMCDTYSKCMNCPLYTNCITPTKSQWYMDFQSGESTIMSWAAEHPEPVYPTWREWLIGLGIISFRPDFNELMEKAPTTITNAVIAYINDRGSEHIPADIAQKLGIEPKPKV